MDWRHRAACRDEDPELFFPIGTSGPALLQVEQAKAVCRRCSVTDECLQWALETGQDAGVWGGMSEEERRTDWWLQLLGGVNLWKAAMATQGGLHLRRGTSTHEVVTTAKGADPDIERAARMGPCQLSEVPKFREKAT